MATKMVSRYGKIFRIIAGPSLAPATNESYTLTFLSAPYTTVKRMNRGIISSEKYSMDDII